MALSLTITPGGSTVRRWLPHSLPDYPNRRKRFVPAAADFSDEVLEKLESLEQEFYSYPHNLTDSLFAYVSAHPEEFGALPKPDDA